MLPAGAASLAQRLSEVTFDELAEAIMMWVRRLPNRRDVLSKLSAALTVAAAAPVLNVLDPQLTLHSVLGHRHLAQRLAKTAPAEFQQRAISVYAELTQFVGWLCFNLCDYRGAQHYYDDARSAAHDAQNLELVTYALCCMSHLATWQGKPRVGIDHAVAAAAWAKQIPSPHAQAYAADVTVRAYVADNQPGKFREALDHEYVALTAVLPDVPTASCWTFYGEAFYWCTASEAALKLEQPEVALSAIDKSLTLVDPANLHETSFTLLFRAEARIQQEAIDEASSIIGDVARRAAVGRSQRLDQRISNLRGLLVPWHQTKPVRELDEQLAAYRPASGNGNGSTNSTYSR
ncbi:MAG: hypothetical protein ACT4NY_02550 [Pseudonocardiales bacterium]